MPLTRFTLAADENITLSGTYTLQSVPLVAWTYEVQDFVMTAGATSDGNASVELNGVTFSVPVLATDNTATLVATKVRAFAYSGWATSGTGATVRFTATTRGERSGAYSFSGGTTGATGTDTSITLGITGSTVLAAGQNDATSNGPHVVLTGAWERHPDYDSSADFVWFVDYGIESGDYEQYRFRYVGPESPTLGSTLLEFIASERPEVLKPGAGLAENPTGYFRLPLYGLFGNPQMSGFERGVYNEFGLLVAREFDYAGHNFIRGLLPRVASGVWQTSRGEYFGGASGEIAYKTTHISTSTSISTSGLSADTWYYFYAYNVFEYEGAIERTTIVPTMNPPEYFANRYDPVFDRYSRYAFALRTNASSVYHNVTVERDGNNPFVSYLEQTNLAPFRVLAAGVATVQTSISCAAVVPPTSRKVRVRIKNNATAGTARVYPSGITGTYKYQLAPGEGPVIDDIDISTTQTFDYAYSAAPTGGGLDVDVLGYHDRR